MINTIKNHGRCMAMNKAWGQSERGRISRSTGKYTNCMGWQKMKSRLWKAG